MCSLPFQVHKCLRALEDLQSWPLLCSEKVSKFHSFEIRFAVIDTIMDFDCHPPFLLLGGSQTRWKFGHHYASVRLNEGGRLAGHHLDMIDFSNLPVTRRTAGNETELIDDFCLTWSNDPR